MEALYFIIAVGLTVLSIKLFVKVTDGYYIGNNSFILTMLLYVPVVALGFFSSLFALMEILYYVTEVM